MKLSTAFLNDVWNLYRRLKEDGRSLHTLSDTLYLILSQEVIRREYSSLHLEQEDNLEHLLYAGQEAMRFLAKYNPKEFFSRAEKWEVLYHRYKKRRKVVS